MSASLQVEEQYHNIMRFIVKRVHQQRFGVSHKPTIFLTFADNALTLAERLTHRDSPCPSMPRAVQGQGTRHRRMTVDCP